MTQEKEKETKYNPEIATLCLTNAGKGVKICQDGKFVYASLKSFNKFVTGKQDTVSFAPFKEQGVSA